MWLMMMMNRIAVGVGVLLTITTASAAAQKKGTVEGKVLDAGDDRALAGVNVRCNKDQTCAPEPGMSSGVGDWSKRSSHPQIQISFTKDNFVTEIRTYRIEPKKTTVAAAVRLQRIKPVSEFTPQQALGTLRRARYVGNQFDVHSYAANLFVKLTPVVEEDLDLAVELPHQRKLLVEGALHSSSSRAIIKQTNVMTTILSKQGKQAFDAWVQERPQRARFGAAHIQRALAAEPGELLDQKIGRVWAAEEKAELVLEALASSR